MAAWSRGPETSLRRNSITRWMSLMMFWLSLITDGMDGLMKLLTVNFPQVYMTPILHMPINMLSSTLDSRIVYDGPQVYYISRNGNLVQSAANEWPLMFIDGVAVGRVPPEVSVTNRFLYSSNFSSSNWNKGLVSVSVSETGVLTAAGTYDVTATTTSGNHLINQTIDVSVGVGDKVTFSFFAKSKRIQFHTDIRARTSYSIRLSSCGFAGW